MIRGTLGCVTLTVGLVVTGCGGPDDPVPTISEEIRDVEQTPPADPADDDARRSDRDPAAVTAALWTLDPCSLIVPGTGKSEAVESYSPHTCSLDANAGEITVAVGERLSPVERTQLGDTEKVGGTQAYLAPGGREAGGCTGWLPVSFTQSIRFEDEYAGCSRIRTVLSRAAERVDTPRSRRPVPGLRNTDTCTLLRNGLGPDNAENHQISFGDDGYSSPGLDECSAVPRSAAKRPRSTAPYTSLEVSSAQDETLTFEEGHSETPTPDTYASSGWPDAFGSIRGRQVYGSRADDADDRCTMRWAEATTVLQLDAASCARGRRIVARMTRVLDSPDRERVTQQRRLLYGTDQAVVPGVGACVDYLPLSSQAQYVPGYDEQPVPDCYRYSEAEVPEGAAEKVAAAEADPDVTCAIAAEAVREEFAERLQPATLDAHVPRAWAANPGERVNLQPPMRVRPCVFTDPERSLQVQAFVSSDPLAISEDAGDQLEEVDSALRLVLQDELAGTGYIIGLGKKPEDPGYVAVLVADHRGTDSTDEDGNRQHKAQTATARAADAIVDEHFTPAR